MLLQTVEYCHAQHIKHIELIGCLNEVSGNGHTAFWPVLLQLATFSIFEGHGQYITFMVSKTTRSLLLALLQGKEGICGSNAHVLDTLSNEIMDFL